MPIQEPKNSLCRLTFHCCMIALRKSGFHWVTVRGYPLVFLALLGAGRWDKGKGIPDPLVGIVDSARRIVDGEFQGKRLVGGNLVVGLLADLGVKIP